MKRRAFSLIELLVVISIISLLVSIALPSLQRIRRYAKQVACRTNLKSIGTGWEMWRQENPNSLPNASSLPILPGDVSLADVMSKETSNKMIWKCPGDDRQYFQKYGISYEYYLGFLIVADPTIEPVLLDLLDEEPTKHAIIGDAEAFHPAPENLQRRLSVYYDGHVDWLLGSEE